MHHNLCCKDEGYVQSVQNKLESQETVDSLADFFKIMGDPTRLKILTILLEGEICVGTITDILEMSQSSISHQLRVLKRARLIKSRKDGKWVYYSINDDHVKIIYAMGLSHIKE